MARAHIVQARKYAGVAEALLSLPTGEVVGACDLAIDCLRSGLQQLTRARAPGRVVVALLQTADAPQLASHSMESAEARFDILILLARAYIEDDCQAKGRLTIAESLLRICASEALQKGLADHGYRALLALGKILFEQHRYHEAIPIHEAAIRYVEGTLASTIRLERRSQILRRNADLFDRTIISLVEADRLSDAFGYVERGKSQTIADLIALRDVRHAAVVPSVIEEYADLLLKARSLSHGLAQSSRLETGGLVSAVTSIWAKTYMTQGRQEFHRVTTRLQELLLTIQRSDPDFHPEPVDLGLRDMMKVAGTSRSALVLFRVTSSGTYMFMVTPRQSHLLVSKALTRRALDGLLVSSEAASGWFVRYQTYQAAVRAGVPHQGSQNWSSLEQARQGWLSTMQDTLKVLSEDLMGPLRHELRKELADDSKPTFDHLVLIPNRALSVLPLHACSWEENGDQRCLLDEFTVTYAPSVSIYQRCLDRDHSREGRQEFLGLFNPSPPGNLLFADWEWLKLRRLLSEWHCRVFHGEDATVQSLMDWAEHCHLLHFSCHGEYRLDAPLDSSLGLAAGAKLTLRGIMEGIRLRNAWLVALSACETGLVDYRDAADEHYGLPMAFVLAGAPTVWGTFWSVNDLPTALILIRAYQNLPLCAYDKATALRKAQLWLRDATAAELVGVLDTMLGDSRGNARLFSEVASQKRDLRLCLPEDRPFAHPYYWASLHSVGA